MHVFIEISTRGCQIKMSATSTTPAVPAAKFKPAHQIVLVVPSKSAAELKLRESLAVLKVFLAMKAKKIECDLVTLSECK